MPSLRVPYYFVTAEFIGSYSDSMLGSVRVVPKPLMVLARLAEVDAIALGAVLSACRWDVSLALLCEMVAGQLRTGPQMI